MPTELVASPFDRNLIGWQREPLELASVPYASGSVDPKLYDADPHWSKPAIKQRWPYASTYQVAPATWIAEHRWVTYGPVASSPHGLMSRIQDPPHGGRRRIEVAFPSNKVQMFEEYDRFSDSVGIAWVFPEAQCNLLFFDGSVSARASANANPGWNPVTPDELWRQRWRSLDLFPTRYRGDHTDRWFQYFRWTREGLRGLDFGGGEINLPENVRNNPNYPG
ncbi:MAG: hypothetical protein RIB60_07845 [Phycisphaerales bacterium]